MTMVSTGPISLGGSATTAGLNQSVSTELGRSSSASINMNESAVRTLAGVPSGEISLRNFYGKSNAFIFNQTISTNVTNYNLRNAAIVAGWDQIVPLAANITVSGGVYVSSDNTGTPAFATGSSFPEGSTLSLTNGGFIVGMGGAGGAGMSINVTIGSGGAPGSAGGVAISAATAISITNNGTIGGGGGGGGGGSAGWDSDGKTQTWSQGGGGGGGGRSGAAANSAGGAGGAATGGGSLLFPGSNGGAGTVSSAGSGGQGGTTGGPRQAGTGGSGGNWGAAGASGTNIVSFLVSAGSPFGGGAAGAAISGNSNITWLLTGTRLGPIT